MKSGIITVIALGLFVALAGCSQDRTSAVDTGMDASAKAGLLDEMGPGNGPGGIYSVLDLTEEQKEKIAAIFAEYRKPGCEGENEECDGKKKKRHGKRGKGMKGRRAGMKKHREEIHQKVMAVLTAEQQAKAAALKAKLDAGEMPEELVDARIERMSALLSFTDDQKAELKELFQKTGNAMLALRNEEGKKRGEMKKLHEESETAMLSIFTAEQQETWQEMKEARKERRKKHMKRMHGKHEKMRLERLTADLNLTADQQKAVKAILDAIRKDKKDLRKDDMDREARREAMKEHHEEVQAQIMALLTPEQQELYKKHMEAHKERRKEK